MDDLLADEEKEQADVEEQDETEGQPPQNVEGFEPVTEPSVEIPPPNERFAKELPPPKVAYYNFETAMKRVVGGIKVCRSIWDPSCFLIDKHRRINGRSAILPWNPGRADSNATDWMDFAVRLKEV